MTESLASSLTKAVNVAENRTLAVVMRVFAAVVLGFVLTNTTGVLLSFLLPLPKSEATATATLLSFLVYLLIVLWSFAVKSLRRLWFVLGASIVLTSTGAWCLHWLEVGL